MVLVFHSDRVDKFGVKQRSTRITTLIENASGGDDVFANDL